MKIVYMLLLVFTLGACGNSVSPPKESLVAISMSELVEQLKIGDIIFIRATALPFKKIARDTGSWTNHVGIIVDKLDGEYQVAESTFPFSTITPLSHFIARSEDNRFAISRLNKPLTPEQRNAMKEAAEKRLGILYDTGFNLHFSRQFCSRYVCEVVNEATDQNIGDVTTLSKLFKQNPDADMLFWRIWYLGFIPWERETITPASMLNSTYLHYIFDGYLQARS